MPSCACNISAAKPQKTLPKEQGSRRMRYSVFFKKDAVSIPTRLNAETKQQCEKNIRARRQWRSRAAHNTGGAVVMKKKLIGLCLVIYHHRLPYEPAVFSIPWLRPNNKEILDGVVVGGRRSCF